MRPRTRILILFAILLMMAATAAHMLEAEKQPEQFGSLPGSMWWAVVTLTTTGYGDVVPSTTASRIFSLRFIDELLPQPHSHPTGS